MAAKAPVSGKRPISQFSVRDKLEAIQRVHNGESKASVARHIGVPESTLRGWCKSEDKLRSVARSCGTPEESLQSEPDLGPSDSKRARLEPLPPPPQQSPELDEALMFWLKQQQQQQQQNQVGVPVVDAKEKDGWFWRWYKRYGFSQFPTQNGSSLDQTVRSSLDQTVRSTLDSVLHTHNNNNVAENKGRLEESDEDDEEDEPPATAAEAVTHGEKFLRWLECCSDPSVTAMQILQFRYLLNNVRACADRRAKQGKARTRRK